MTVAGSDRSSAGHAAKIGPFRYYETGHFTPAGTRGPKYVVIILKAGAPGGSLAGLTALGDQITPDEILDMLARWTKIRDIELSASLCKDLNIMRVTDHAEIFKSEQDPVEIFLKTLGALELALPAMITELNLSFVRSADGVRSAATSRRRRLGGGLSKLESAIENVRRHLVPSSGATNQSAFWHGDARYLAFCLDRWAQLHNRRIGFTKPTALGVKFIHHALKRAGVAHGASPEGAYEAIASELSRWRQSSKPS